MNQRLVLLLSALLVLQAAGSQPVAGSGTLEVRVTRGGQPVANATVCVGIASDLNLFHQGTSDSLGRVQFHSVPPDSFVATANAGGSGTQQVFNRNTPVSLSLVLVQLSLPVSGGPTCPSTPAGPSRTLLPHDLELPARQPIESQPIQIGKTEVCFGALGAQCGQPQTGIPATALCASGVCFINGGSWQHDECCFDHPNGMACRQGPLDAVTGNDGNCVSSWNKAVRLASKGLFWQRDVNFSRGNASGTVEFNLCCAPKNALVPPADEDKCCSRDSRALTLAEGAAATAIGETLKACK